MTVYFEEFFSESLVDDTIQQFAVFENGVDICCVYTVIAVHKTAVNQFGSPMKDVAEYPIVDQIVVSVSSGSLIPAIIL